MKGLLLLTLLACGLGADLRRGQEALDAGDLAAAETAFRSALDRDPESVDALYGMGWTWHVAGDDDAARGAFQQLLALAPTSPLPYKGLGSVAMAEGNLPEARTRFKEALDRAPDDLAILHSLALVDLSAKQGTAALAGFDALITREPGRAEFHQARAEALLLLDRAEDALAAATRAVELGGTARVQVLARLTRARALLAASAHRIDADHCASSAPAVYAWLDEADRMLDEAIALQPGAPELATARQAVSRRRGAVDDLCPGLRTTTGKGFPGG